MRIPYAGAASLNNTFIELAEDIVAAIVMTVAQGWQHALTFEDVNVGAGEVPMTERLRDGMRIVLKMKNHPWGKELIILPGTESRSSPSVLLPDGRTDIPIVTLNVFLRTQEHDPHAILECKRIAGANAHLCREYVREGMDRFRSGKYGENHAFGFMVGYVLAGDLNDAVNGINDYLSRQARSSEALSPDSTEPTGICWRSDHLRDSPQRPIHLKHVFLAVSSVSV